MNLRPFNTLGVEAVAGRFAAIGSPGQLQQLHREDLLRGPLLVLGSGSNILFRGKTDRLVLKNEIRLREIVEESDDRVHLKAGAGENWHDLVAWCVEQGWGGLENLALIPGTAGAAPIQNIGAYGVELKDSFVSLEAFDLQEGSFRVFTAEECRFGYRDSMFKREYAGRFVITSVTLRLQKAPHQVNSGYRSLQAWLEGEGIAQPGIGDIYRGVVAIRSSKLPDPAVTGNAGSFFKNPVIGSGLLATLEERYPEVPSWPAGNGSVKIPAAWLIEKAGWRGKRVGNAGTYEKQALVIVNHGSATGQEIWELACTIRDSVRELFGVELMPEVNVIPDGECE